MQQYWATFCAFYNSASISRDTDGHRGPVILSISSQVFLFKQNTILLQPIFMFQASMARRSKARFMEKNMRPESFQRKTPSWTPGGPIWPPLERFQDLKSH